MYCKTAIVHRMTPTQTLQKENKNFAHSLYIWQSNSFHIEWAYIQEWWISVLFSMRTDEVMRTRRNDALTATGGPVYATVEQMICSKTVIWVMSICKNNGRLAYHIEEKFLNNHNFVHILTWRYIFFIIRIEHRIRKLHHVVFRCYPLIILFIRRHLI